MKGERHLELCEDSFRLEMVLSLLKRVNPDNIVLVEKLEDRRQCEKELSAAVGQLRRWQRYAWNRLRHEVLAQ